MVWPPPQPNQNIPLAGRVERSVLAVRPDKPPWNVTAAIDNAVLMQSDPKKATTATITVKQTRDWADLKQPIAVQSAAAGTARQAEPARQSTHHQ